MYAQKKSIDNTHIVREKDRQRNRELLAVLSLGVPIGFFLLVFAWQNLEVIRLGREATQLQKTLKDQEAAHKQLQGELDRLTSFDAVEKQVAKLGFEPAAPTAIVMVEKRAEDLGLKAESPAASPQTESPAEPLNPQPSTLSPSSVPGPRPTAAGPAARSAVGAR
jgi:hypothetical protein